MNSTWKKISFLLVFAIATTMCQVRSWNDASRMATVQSLVENHSFIIDTSVFVKTGDKVFINGHFYSDKPAMPSMLAALVYWPLYHLGIKLDYGPNTAYFLITLCTVKLLWILGLIAFYGALQYTDLDNRKRVLLTAALGFASLHLTWSAVFNNHSLAASTLTIGFYFLLRAKHLVSTKTNLFLAGLFLCLAGVSDVPVALFYVGFLIYILANSALRSHLLYYLLPLLPTVLPALFVNYHISGSLVPVQLITDYFKYPGSPYYQPDRLSGIHLNRGLFLLQYSFTALIGKKGFIVYNPLLLISLYYLIREVRRGRMFKPEALVIAMCSLILVLYYLSFSNDYSGYSYSIRWFVPLLPVLYFFIYPFFSDFDLKRQRFFSVLFGISLTISLIGLINPWSNASISPVPLISNIKELVGILL